MMLFKTPFFLFLFSFMTFFVVDGSEGSEGGSGADGSAGADGDNDDGADGSAGTDGDSDDGADEGKNLDSDALAELERLKAIVDASEREKLIADSIADISSRHDAFNQEEVKNFLIKLNESDPAKAEALNNPVGWELIHLQNFASKEVKNDYVGHGREGESTDRSEEILEKVQKGGVSIADEAVALAKLL